MSNFHARVFSIFKTVGHIEGIMAEIDQSLAKRWVLRTMVNGKRRDMGLGGTRTVSLSEAREKATEFRKIARGGGDPISERQKQKKHIPTFEEATEKVYLERASTWKNSKHKAQWINTLRKYAYPVLKKRKINSIGSPDILEVLGPIWLEKAETARRVRQRIGTVFDWAKAAGVYEGDNPIAGVTQGLPKQSEKAKASFRNAL